MIKVENQLNLDISFHKEIEYLFNSVVINELRNFNTQLTSTLDHCTNWVSEKINASNTLNNYFIHLKASLYHSPIVTPIDCMIHQCMNDILSIQKLIQKSINLKLTSHFFLSSFLALKRITKKANTSFVENEISSQIISYLEKASKHVLDILKSSEAKMVREQIANPIKRLFNFFDLLKNFIDKFENTQSTSMLYRALFHMWGAPDQDVAKVEIDAIYVKQCFIYTSWCLNYLSIDEFNT